MESVPAPGSGPVVLAILNILEGYENLKQDNVTYHRLIEAFKFAFAQREKLGDPIDNEEEIEKAMELMIR